MAIHDAHYSTPPASWPDLMWRMQYISEMRVGKAVRAERAREDAKVRKAQEASG